MVMNAINGEIKRILRNVGAIESPPTNGIPLYNLAFNAHRSQILLKSSMIKILSEKRGITEVFVCVLINTLAVHA
tara:strand:+ start:705 stop:929 length:225 start_codon:yes stop_codon:yes gene_type:complete